MGVGVPSGCGRCGVNALYQIILRYCLSGAMLFGQTTDGVMAMADKTLLEILVDELPGFGGWPSNKRCKVCTQDAQLSKFRNGIVFYSSPPRSRGSDGNR